MKNLKSTEKAGLFANRWNALAVLCAAQFMVIMDTSIIGVALPAIQESLNYGANSLHWIFNAYVIVFGGLLLLGGKFSDIYGPKKVFINGFLILTIASLFAGFAWNEATLNLGRAFQGLGAALIAPSALTLLMTMFTDPKELGKALGFWGASAAAGGSAGVFLGGVLTEFLDWRWTFFINIPLGIIVLIAGSKYMIEGFKQKGRLDILGAALITGAVSSLVYALVSLESHGFDTLYTWMILLGSVFLFFLFVIGQIRNGQRLLPFSIFKAKNLSAANIVMALLAGSWIPLWFFFNLYLQKILHFSAFYSGLALLPMTLAIMVLMVVFSSKIVAALGVKGSLISGMTLLSLALIWFAYLPEGASYFGQVIWPSLLAAAGMSLAYVPATIAALSGAQPEQAGIASGIANSTYQIGSAIGLALAVAISYSVGSENLLAGYSAAFMVAAVLSILGLFTSLIKIKN